MVIRYYRIVVPQRQCPRFRHAAALKQSVVYVLQSGPVFKKQVVADGLVSKHGTKSSTAFKTVCIEPSYELQRYRMLF